MDNNVRDNNKALDPRNTLKDMIEEIKQNKTLTEQDALVLLLNELVEEQLGLIN